MKTKKKLIITLTLFATLIIGALVVKVETKAKGSSNGAQIATNTTPPSPSTTPNEKSDASTTTSANALSKSTKQVHNANLIRGNGSYSRLARANIDDVFIHGFEDKKLVALTFDDGPDSTLTPKLLDVLKSYDVKVSFFVIGNRIDNAPDVLKRAYDEGHLILNHSYTHPDFKKLDSESIKNEVKEDEDKIYSIIGKRPAIVRPPFGSVDQRVVNTLDEIGCKTMLWSIDTLDWQHKDKNKTINSVMNSVKTEDIVLMHMTQDQISTLEAVPTIIEKLRAQGYSFVTLDKLLEINAYK